MGTSCEPRKYALPPGRKLIMLHNKFTESQ